MSARQTLLDRLQARMEMNLRHAESHPDETARKESAIRALAYKTALQDAQDLLPVDDK